MYRRLMVPLDGMVDCQHAIPLALSIAARDHAVVELVHVAMPPSMAAQMAAPGLEYYSSISLDQQAISEARSTAERDLLALAAEAGQATDVHVESIVLDRSDVARAIAEYAEESQPDLVIMTTHDHSRLERLVLGSVPESVVRRVHVPVVLVPGGHEKPSFTRRIAIDHILVPLDGSELAATVTPHARALAKTMDSRITLFTVAEEGMIPPPPGLAAHDGILEPSAVDARTFLTQASAEFRGAGIPTETSVVIARDRARAILDFAEHNAVDLIAMSTHGRRGLGRLVAGSVAAKVLRHAKVPVMLYRPPQQGEG